MDDFWLLMENGEAVESVWVFQSAISNQQSAIDA
jgi:hypothetical protein